MDAVLADAAAGHHDVVAGLDELFPAVAVADLARERADRAAVDQRLADVAVVEVFPADGVRDAALVAAVDHALVDAVAEAARMQEAFGDVDRVGERRAEAVAPDVQQQIGALSGPERVAVHAHDAGHGSAVGIERGRAVVGLGLVDEVEAVVEADHAGVVGEDGDEPRHLGLKLLRALLDVALVERGDRDGLAVRGGVVDVGGEDFVLAVFAPGLREDFHLHVGRLAAELAEIALDGLHFLEAESERALVGQLHELFVGDFQVVVADDDLAEALDDGLVQRDGAVHELVAGEDVDRFDQDVREQAGGDALRLFAGHFGGIDQILDRAEDLFLAGELAADDVADGLPRRAGHVVRHARLEPDADQPGEIQPGGRRFAHDAAAGDRVGQFVRDLRGFVRRDVRGDGVDGTCADAADGRQTGESGEAADDALAAGVLPLRLHRHFNTIVHELILAWRGCLKNYSKEKYTPGNTIFQAGGANQDFFFRAFARTVRKNAWNISLHSSSMSPAVTSTL